jgi:hypothetical protein
VIAADPSKLGVVNSNPGLLIGSPPLPPSRLAIPPRTNECVMRPKRALDGPEESISLFIVID